MKVKVEYVSALKLKGVQSGDSLELEGPATIADLLSRWGIPEHQQRYIVPIVNGKKQRASYRLQHDDALYLLLPLGGG